MGQNATDYRRTCRLKIGGDNGRAYTRPRKSKPSYVVAQLLLYLPLENPAAKIQNEDKGSRETSASYRRERIRSPFGTAGV